MNIKTKLFCLFLVTNNSTVLSRETMSIPGKYEKFITETKSNLEKRKKTVESKLSHIRSRAVYGTAAELLQSSLDHINQQLRNLEDKRMNLKSNGPKSVVEEKILIRKTKINNEIEDLNERISEVRRMEQFFEKQKSSKTIINNWTRQREKHERKLQQLRISLQAI